MPTSELESDAIERASAALHPTKAIAGSGLVATADEPSTATESGATTDVTSKTASILALSSPTIPLRTHYLEPCEPSTPAVGAHSEPSWVGAVAMAFDWPLEQQLIPTETREMSG